MIKKSKILFTTLLLPILSFSYELEFSKSFSQVVNPDLLTTNININIEKKDENKINMDIEKFNDFIKENKNIIIKNGSYNLSPKYKYYDNKQEFVGYVGSLRYTAESKDAKELNAFLNELIALKDKSKSDDVKLNISNISWRISDEVQNQKFDELRLESIKWVESYAKELSSSLAKNCETKKININEVNGIMPIYARNEMALSSTMSKVVADVAPISSEQTITVNPYFLLECK